MHFSSKLNTYTEISGTMWVLVSDLGRLALVKLPGLTIVFKCKSKANFCKVKANIAALLLTNSQSGQKEEENCKSHFDC